jgi:hypothetical protein
MTPRIIYARVFLSILFILTFASASQAATFYMANSGCSDSWSGNITNPVCSFHAAFPLMRSGDTLLIEDGIYTDHDNAIGWDVVRTVSNVPPSGPGTGIGDAKYTIIRAKNIPCNDGIPCNQPLRVRFEGNATFRGDDHAVAPTYVKFHGIRWNGLYTYTGWNHIYFKQVASMGVSDGNTATFSITGQYNLLEDCIAFGKGRYKFLFYDYSRELQTNGIGNNVCRRCVSRHDWAKKEDPTQDPIASFSSYFNRGTALLNPIDIDSNIPAYWMRSPGEIAGSFLQAVDPSVAGPHNLTVRGGIAINSAFHMGSSASTQSNYTGNNYADIVGINVAGGFMPRGGGSFNRITLVNVDSNVFAYRDATQRSQVSGRDKGILNYYGDLTYNMTNSIFKNISGVGFSGVGVNDYVNLYAIAGGNYNSVTPAQHLITTDPSLNGLLYPVRIESGSSLATAGSDGSQMGARILNKIGVDGTFKGEPNWDTEQGSLWPWPYEDWIKAELRTSDYVSFCAPYIGNATAACPASYVTDSRRGFAGDGTGLYGGPMTLTSYIWESLGNPCPANVCSYGNSDTTSPTLSNGAPTGTLAAGTTQTTLSLTTNEAATCRYSTIAGTSYASMTNTFSTTGSTSHSTVAVGLTNGNTYSYYIRCIDGSGNANTNDYTIYFSVTSSPRNTYYMAPVAGSPGWSAGNDVNSGLSKSSPIATLKRAFALMGSGDTLIIANGTYTGYDNQIARSRQLPLNGTSSYYTRITAESPGGVQFDGQNTLDMLDPVGTTRMSYIEFNGIEWINGQAGLTGAAWDDRSNHHIKFIKCGAEDSFGVYYSSYVLLEDFYVWGSGRYNFILSVSDHVICRRCVARLDAANGTGKPISNYQNYDSEFVEFQNSIAIDSNDDYYTDFEGLYGGFTVRGPYDVYRNGQFVRYYYSNNVSIRGSVILNVKNDRTGIQSTPATWSVGNNVTNLSIENSIFWDMNSGTFFSYTYPNQDFTIDHSLFGTATAARMVWGNFGKFINVSNSVFVNINGTALDKVNSSLRNAFYGNTLDKDQVLLQTNDVSGVNPFTTGGLRYLPRIETTGTFYNAGSDGKNIGVDITKQIGVSGTLWGETGWNIVTNENLWPWPNENAIKNAFRTYGVQSNPNPRRGFAADGNGLYGGPITLTSYIWEYLGNSCPSNICNYGTSQPLTCAQAGGTCRTDQCSSYQGCASLTGTCSSGYCCSGSCTAPQPQQNNTLSIGGVIRRTLSAFCPTCLITVSLAGKTNSTATNNAGLFSVTIEKPLAGNYVLVVTINDGAISKTFRKRVAIA